VYRTGYRAEQVSSSGGSVYSMRVWAYVSTCRYVRRAQYASVHSTYVLVARTCFSAYLILFCKRERGKK
jgi:hypothetical protein